MTKRDRAVLLASQKGYRVDVSGKVYGPSGRELKTKVCRTCRTCGKSRLSYSMFNVVIDAECMPVPVHRLVGLQKYGEKVFDHRLCIRHLDGDSKNNREGNISIGTLSENMMDQSASNRRIHAARAGQHLSEEIIQKLRADHLSGLGYRKLREKYGLPLSTLSYYLSRRAKRRTFLFAQTTPEVPA